LAVAAPAGSGKTVTLTKVVPLWKTYCRPTKEILTVSASADMAGGWMDEIRVKVETSEELREDFGDVRGMRWGGSDLEFIFQKGGRTVRRAIMKARGKGCAIRGLRPDHIFMDDPEDEESVRSEKQREDFREWFMGALITRLDTSQKQLTYVGTAFDEFCYVCDLINSPPHGWVARCYSAIQADGTSLWPEKWPLEYLDTRRKEMGEARFAADYMNAPIHKGKTRGFNASDIQHEVRVPRTDSMITMCLDPSFVAGGDAWALTVVEVTREGTWHVLEYASENNGMGPCLEAFFSLAKAYPNLRAIGVEIGGGGQASVKFNIEDMQKRRQIRLPEIVWIHHSNQRSKEQRIGMLCPLFEGGRIKLSHGMVELRGELVNWKPGATNQKDNILDSLSMHFEVQLPRLPAPGVRTKSWSELTSAERVKSYDDFAGKSNREIKQRPWDRYLGLNIGGQ
jgi:hypothetical protein